MNEITYGAIALIILLSNVGFALYAYRPRIFNLFLNQYLLVRILKQLFVYGFLAYLAFNILLAVLLIRKLYPIDVLTMPAEEYVVIMQFLFGVILLLFFRNACQAEERLRQLEVKTRNLQYDLRALTEDSVDESIKAELSRIHEGLEFDLSPENGYFFTVTHKYSYWNDAAKRQSKRGKE
jgi:hypothetical protein